MRLLTKPKKVLLQKLNEDKADKIENETIRRYQIYFRPQDITDKVKEIENYYKKCAEDGASNKQTLLDIINNVNISEAEKTAASEKMVAITTSSEKEVAAELMLEAKGFNNVIVSILNDKVDVVVERESLTETEIAQIEDIVTRKTDVPVTNLTITPVESRDK